MSELHKVPARTKSGYNREHFITVESDEECVACGGKGMMLCCDSSEGEYGPTCLCIHCIGNAFLHGKLKGGEINVKE